MSFAPSDATGGGGYPPLEGMSITAEGYSLFKVENTSENAGYHEVKVYTFQGTIIISIYIYMDYSGSCKGW